MRYLFIVIGIFLGQSLHAQSSSPRERIDSIGRIVYTIPEFFEYKKEDSLVFMEMRNNDTSVCQMRIFPYGMKDVPKDSVIRKIWKEVVPKLLTKGDDTPRQVLPDTSRNGWKTSSAIGNYREGGKRAIVVFSVVRKDDAWAIIMVNFSDRIFRQPVNKFDAGLRLKD